MRITLTALTPQGAHDVVVEGDEGSTVAGLAVALQHTLRTPKEQLADVLQLPRPRQAGRHARRPYSAERLTEPAAPVIWLDGRPLDPAARISQALRDGDLVALDRRGAAATVKGEPAGTVEVRVSSGPAAGAVHRLGFGTAVLGSGPSAAIAVPDPALPAVAATVRVTPEGVRVEPAGGAAVTLDGEAVEEKAEWLPGGVLKAGSSVLTLHHPEAADAHLDRLPDGGLAYNRPPRLRPPDRQRRLEVPIEPKRPEGMRLQLLAAFLPAVLGVGLAFAMKTWYFLLFALMTPMIMIGQWWSDRRHGKKKHRQAMKEYRERLAAFEERLERAQKVDETERRANSPDPAEVLLTATGPRRRLWERRIHDGDTLRLRVGLADLPADLELVPERGAPADAVVPELPTSHAVPVALAMQRLGVVGLTGPRRRARALARWLIGQAAVLHSPRDLAIVVLSASAEGPAEWNWVRWLPHASPRDGEECVALVGADPEAAAKRVSELVAKIAERRGEREEASLTGGPFGRSPFAAEEGTAFAAYDDRPYNVLVVLDGAQVLRALPGMPQVLRQGPHVGVYTVAIDDDQRLLPEECATVATIDDEGSVRLRGGGLDALGRVLADQVSPAWCDRLARSLAPVRDVSRADGDALIPEAARLLDLLDLADPSADVIASWWRRGGRTTSVPIGIGADGIFTVDLRVDGPHGLIAGTTGAGKSELLQTLITSLAVANRPDEMTFVLIDYKGGSAFKDCARLPHTVGMVTDLDGHLTERALESLAAELRRRERLLLEAGAKDIDDYQDLRDAARVTRRGGGLPALPRLVLIIDEFAALVSELPDFVTGLVDIARRGRSLGVHLILATQRPGGVVTADIQANTSLRIALRVTDAAESADVIGQSDAAHISKSTPGRCYVKSGASKAVAVQTARIGGRRSAGGTVEAAPLNVVPLPWPALGKPLPRPASDDAADESMVTDLAVLVDAIRAAAVQLGIKRQPSPWLPPLPERVVLADLGPARPYNPGVDEVPALPYGLTDMPWAQTRRPLVLDPASGGHVLIAGTTRTGRSTALRSLAGSIARTASPADVHLHAIDCGSGSLLPLVALPHCGAVVTRDQLDRVERLITRLRTEVGRRQQVLAEAGYASLAEARAAGGTERMPWMLLLLDRWEGYVAAFEPYDYGRLIESLLSLLREGPAVGLRAIVTSDRSGLLGHVSTVFDERLLLRLADPTDAGLLGIPIKSMPTRQPPGRVVAMGASGLVESQIVLLDPDPSGPAQVSALQALARSSEECFGRPPRGLRPLRVDALPIRVTAAQALALDPDFSPPSPLWALLGAGGDELAPYGVDLLSQGPGCVIGGPARSGRSSALVTAVRSLTGRGVPVIAVTPRRSPLRDLGAADGVVGVLPGDATREDLAALTSGLARYVVVVDDAELISPDSPLGQALEDVLRTGRDAEHGLLIAGTTGDLASAYRGFVAEARKARTGLLLSVQSPTDGDLFNVRLPRNAGGGPAGRGLLVHLGTLIPIQAALPD
ncbi:FtsK/SpoIIIE domain-containing protein [Bailinhaonella thermotolerans]|uniref:Cell division protein FtsK n=1 Tax=Bailinhaonella thermotolerans TaxID=1070861 RepID=A0A3A4B0T5_9ACTN|nr:FtsK/SpoIIIE domain-containing protein [Bailinhaonella thermotolerans]RJL33548.1 cell division protein FtsK [Bailinhaonella thermotolerans]